MQVKFRKTYQAMRRIKVWVLRWSFTSKELENTVASLENNEQIYTSVLLKDQTWVFEPLVFIANKKH